MVGNPEVLRTLTAALSAERHLNLQCRQDADSLKCMGAKKTSKKINHFADNAHGYYRRLTHRILFLEGDPSTAIAATVEMDSLTAVLKNQLDLRVGLVGSMETAIQVAMKAFDDATRNLFEHLIKWMQKEIGWLETQLSLIKKLGESDYLSEML